MLWFSPNEEGYIPLTPENFDRFIAHLIDVEKNTWLTEAGDRAMILRTLKESSGSTIAILLLLAITSNSARGDLIGVAHRGGRTQGPENTLEVFQLTIDLGTVGWLETDTWLSADGVLMIHHDIDLCRTTNIDTFPGYDCLVAANNPLGRFPRVNEFTAASLKLLDVGSWFSPAYAGTTMPTLEEAIALVDGTGVPLLIEVKTPGQGPLIANILSTNGFSVDNVIIWARQPFAYDEFHGVIPGVRQVTGILDLHEITDAFLGDRAAKGDFAIGMVPVGLTLADVEKIHSYGFLTYSLPNATGMDSLTSQLPLGIDAVHVQNEVSWTTYLSYRPCIDGIDNDGDGFVDFDGIDLDFDGIDEIPGDAGCESRLASNEMTVCQDLVDNDGDGFVDLDDPGCLTVNSTSEVDAPPPPPPPGPPGAVPTLSLPGLFLTGLASLGLGLSYSRRWRLEGLAKAKGKGVF
ncbi:MAG: glycerophosphodiester phosphodiesterase family protein [Myxococcota bacterium]